MPPDESHASEWLAQRCKRISLVCAAGAVLMSLLAAGPGSRWAWVDPRFPRLNSWLAAHPSKSG